MLYLILVLLSMGCNKGSTISGFSKAISQDDITAFIDAAKAGRTSTVEDFVALGVNVNASVTTGNGDGKTALMYAASNGYTRTVKALLKLGADVNALDSRGNAALVYAAKEGRTGIVEDLVASGAIIDAVNSGGTAIMWAAKKGRMDTVKALAALNANVNTIGLHNNTALMWAAQEGHTDTVESLAALNADINLADRDGKTALMYAALNGYTDIVDILIEKGVDISSNGRALRLSVMAGHKKTSQALLLAGIDVHEKGNLGPMVDDRTALEWAFRKGYTDIVETLLQFGANIEDQLDTRGFNEDIVELITEYRNLYHTSITSLKARAVAIMIRNHNYNLEMPGCDSVKPTLNLGDKTWLLHNTSNVEDRKFILSLDGALGIPKDE